MDGIQMIGCKENNLKNVDIVIPYSKITTFIGVSGSGKSTVVFDTLYAEGKRRYIESLGVSESFFLSKQQKPNADCFIGIPPAIALAQNKTSRNSRSNVGTITQAAYYVQLLFSSCGESQNTMAKMTPAMFNKNSPAGMCMECGGTGELLDFDETLIWPNQDLSISQGGIKLGGPSHGTTKMKFFESFVQQYGFSIDTPIRELSNETKVALLFGQKKTKKYKVEFPGIIPSFEKTYKTTKSVDLHDEIEKFMVKEPCSCCNCTGYNPDSLAVYVNGYSITEMMSFTIERLKQEICNIIYDDYRKDLFFQISKNLLNILDNCVNLGVGYLSLDRASTTLSGGELQRLHMVSQISSQISGVVYVLDEPSSGMHPSDIDKLLESIKKLNTIGNKNTIVMVEHTKNIINSSDYIYEIGPKAGEEGGYVIAQGKPKDIWNSSTSISGKYLSGVCTPGNVNMSEHLVIKECIELVGVNSHNLKNVDVLIPLNILCCITGVSGSGKTSLIFDAFYQSVQSKRNVHLKSIVGMDKINKVILCDQSHIGTSTRSCPITYSEVYEEVRKIYAEQPLAKKNKLTEKHFSFNLSNGQCPKCKGEGKIHINMGFLPEMSIMCDECNGSRFIPSVLNVKYKDKNISDILNMSIYEAIDLFEGKAKVLSKLIPIRDVGLGYIKLGQPTNTLSGGEVQRLKLAYEMSRVRNEHNLILFDEPSRGLHFEDVKQLLIVMRKLVDMGHTVVAVEHNLDIISSADYVIDVGPYAAENGGEICGKGTPLAISKLNTPTGNALAKYYDELNKCNNM